MNRRSFLQKSALFISLFGPTSLLARSKKNDSGLTVDQWKTVINYARWCPTVHNLQPHRVKIISDKKLELYYDVNRLLPEGDPESIFAMVALGIFIEHLSISAAPYGKSIVIDKIVDEVSIKKSGLVHFADLKVISAQEGITLDRELILKRRTSRKKYNGMAMKASTGKKIATEANNFGHHFQWSNNSDFVDFMTKVNQETLFEDLKNDPVREELDRLFRYDRKTAEKLKDGLSAKCMGFSGQLMKSVFQKHKKWTKGIRRRLLKQRYLQAFKGTETIGWFTGKFNTTTDYLNAGQMFARTWLTLTAEGAYLQPFGSLITNKSAYAKMQKELNIPSGDKRLWLIFRIGYSNTPARSHRLDLDTININQKLNEKQKSVAWRTR